jgi:hypothetical protein
MWSSLYHFMKVSSLRISGRVILELTKNKPGTFDSGAAIMGLETLASSIFSDYS